jgi:GH25 family lysozyme M1 (1,4-beta-N-acetylmuramidase)
MTEQFVDISNFNTVMSWADYRKWSSRIALKTTEGTSYTDPTYAANRANAKAAGIQSLWHYHFARPDTGNNPVNEANFQRSVIGEIGANDLVVLDFEVNDSRATAEWAYQFLAQQEQSYPGQVAIYASTAYILERLQDPRLSVFKLWLASWTYDPASRPACPSPWTNYIALQYSDRATVPGIAGSVDADIFLGESLMTIPVGWHDDGHTLTAPNGIQVVQGFRSHILNSNWHPDNIPLQAAQGLSQLELSNPSLGTGVWQPFNWTVLEWVKSTNTVIEAYAGKELLATRKALAAATTPATPIDNSALITTLTTLSQTLTTVNAAIEQALSNLKS